MFDQVIFLFSLTSWILAATCCTFVSSLLGTFVFQFQRYFVPITKYLKCSLIAICLFSPNIPLPTPFWLLSVCSLFQCLWLYFACLFVCWLSSTYRWDHMDTWTKPKVGRFEGERWGWGGQEGVVGQEWWQLHLNKILKNEIK